MTISFPMLGKFSPIISSDIFSGSFSFSSSSGTRITQMLLHLMLSQRSLRLSLFLFIIFSIFCSVAEISTILSSRSHICSTGYSVILVYFSFWFLSHSSLLGLQFVKVLIKLFVCSLDLCLHSFSRILLRSSLLSLF